MNTKEPKNEEGITILALVITVIVLLILAGISIATLTADNGILKNAVYAKFATEVRDLQEQVNLKAIQEDYSGSGTINEELKINSEYNDLSYIEEGELVYVSSEASDTEKEWLEKLGIKPQSDYFVIKFETAGGTQIDSQTVKSGKNLRNQIIH